MPLSPAGRPPLLLLAIWLAGAAVAVGAGLYAVDLVGSRVGDAGVPPLSAEALDRALASAAPGSRAPSGAATGGASPSGSAGTSPGESTSSRPSATRSAAAPSTAPPPTTAAQPATRTFSSRGGSISVRCQGAAPTLLYATPAQGWTVEDRKNEEGRVEVRFESEDDDVRLRVRCVAGTPTLVDD